MNDGVPTAMRVDAGHDRFERTRLVFGVMPFHVKVAASDTAGRCLVVEQDNDYRGGPPRHVHHAQEEWFYVVRGEYAVEVGGHVHRLSAGDAVLAPRGVPHTWALVGPGPGRMVIAFFPAGDMEAFFDAACALPGMAPHAELAGLFERHGMRVAGPPLDVDAAGPPGTRPAP